MTPICTSARTHGRKLLNTGGDPYFKLIHPLPPKPPTLYFYSYISLRFLILKHFHGVRETIIPRRYPSIFFYLSLFPFPVRPLSPTLCISGCHTAHQPSGHILPPLIFLYDFLSPIILPFYLSVRSYFGAFVAIGSYLFSILSSLSPIHCSLISYFLLSSFLSFKAVVSIPGA